MNGDYYASLDRVIKTMRAEDTDTTDLYTDADVSKSPSVINDIATLQKQFSEAYLMDEYPKILTKSQREFLVTKVLRKNIGLNESTIKTIENILKKGKYDKEERGLLTEVRILYINVMKK